MHGSMETLAVGVLPEVEACEHKLDSLCTLRSIFSYLDDTVVIFSRSRDVPEVSHLSSTYYFGFEADYSIMHSELGCNWSLRVKLMMAKLSCLLSNHVPHRNLS